MARAPFDPADPFEASADALRRGVADVALAVFATSTFQRLSAERQISCVMAGVMTGAMGVMLAFVNRDSHDDLLQAVAEYLPDARRNAYDIATSAPEGGLQ
jgi:hypothetical protein